MTTITDNLAHAMLLHAAAPPATGLLSFMLSAGARTTLDRVLDNTAPPQVRGSISLTMQHALRRECDALAHDYATLVPPEDDAWPATVPHRLPGMNTYLTGLWIYGRAPRATLAGGVGLFGPDLPTPEAVTTAVRLARYLARRDVPILTAGIRGISAPILQAILALRKPMIGRLVVVVTPEEIAECPRDALRLLTRVRAAGALIVHEYPHGRQIQERRHGSGIPEASLATRDCLAGALAGVTVLLEADHDTSPIVSARTAGALKRPVLALVSAGPSSPRDAMHALLQDGIAAELCQAGQIMTALQRS